MSATRRADAVRAVSLSDEQMVEVAFGCVEASERQELQTCHYTPPGRPCAVTELLSSVVAAIVKVRAEIAEYGEYRGEGRPLVMTRKAIARRASYARRRLATSQQVR